MLQGPLFVIRFPYLRFIFTLWVACVYGGPIKAQDSSRVSKFKISAYLEMYYSYDFAQPPDHEKPDFFYNYVRHNEINLNLGYLKGTYADKRLRANLALMAGTYPQHNLATEPVAVRNIYEANAGVCLSVKHKLWLDAGVMPSHIGLESAVGKDNWELTRSIVADNSPYYETGLKLGYTSQNNKLYLAGFYLNGWQRIQRIPGNQSPCFGTQLQLKPNSKWLVNWSTFLGNTFPDSLKKMRYYNNVFAQWQLTEKFGLTAGFDLGLQQADKGSSILNEWWSPLLIARLKIAPKLMVAARVEYFSDAHQVVTTTGTPKGFELLGYSLNLDYALNEHALFRFEGRTLRSQEKNFVLNSAPSSVNYCLSSCVALIF